MRSYTPIIRLYRSDRDIFINDDVSGRTITTDTYNYLLKPVFDGKKYSTHLIYNQHDCQKEYPLYVCLEDNIRQGMLDPNELLGENCSVFAPKQNFIVPTFRPVAFKEVREEDYIRIITHFVFNPEELNLDKLIWDVLTDKNKIH